MRARARISPRLAALGPLAFALLAVRFSPDWFAFAVVARQAVAAPSDAGERQVIENQLFGRYAERGYYVLRQAENLQTEIGGKRPSEL